VHCPNAELEVEALRELMSRADRSFPTLMTLGRDQYRLRVMPEPGVPQRELLSSLRWSLSVESDNPLEEFNFAWMRIPAYDEALSVRPKMGYAITTPTMALSAKLAILRLAGIKPKVVDIRETALRNIAGALERPGEGLALVSADAAGIGMVFTHQGSLFLDRYIEQPKAESQPPESARVAPDSERIAVQLMRSVDIIARSYPFMPVSRVVVAASPEWPGLFDYLSTQLPMTVEPLDLGQIFDMSLVPALAQSPVLQARCIVPLGASLRTARGQA
jgi:MSHA biogenesis protein MshI